MTRSANAKAGGINTLQKQDSPIHGWYRFVLSYPPHLVRQYVSSFGLTSNDIILDPFCGTGTTLVEAKKLGIRSIGCGAHPFAKLASSVKTNWELDATILRERLSTILLHAERRMGGRGLPALSLLGVLLREDEGQFERPSALTEHQQKILPTGFVSEKPLERLLILRNEVDAATERDDARFREFFLLALAHVVANGAGNFAFGPEIYRTKPKVDYDVLGHFAQHASLMISELLAAQSSSEAETESLVLHCDARELSPVPDGISAVITSPPYPNEKDYTRTTRVESLLLGLIEDRVSLRRIKESMLRSNTRNVFVNDNDGDEVREFDGIQRVCATIEARRIEMGKTSGFERLYHKVVAHYFGGMRRHFRCLHARMRPGAKLAYVVGDQLSFLLVAVPTAKLLGDVPQAEGFSVIGCDLWRERIGTKVKNDVSGRKTVRIREEILILKRD